VKGSIKQRSSGSYSIILDFGKDPATGKRQQKWHTFKGTKRQAQDECARLIASMKGGTYLEPSRVMLSQFLDRWLDHARSQVSTKTHQRYGELARKNIIPRLGATALTKLKPAQISAAYAEALASGRRDGTGGLSPRTVHHMHRVLKQALGQAVKWELLNRNPCDAVDPPRVGRGTMQTYDMPQTVEVIEALRETRMLIPALLAVMCGLRRGEVLAIRWKNIDLDAGQITVAESVEETLGKIAFKAPKSGKGRTLALSPVVVDELRAHRSRQSEELLRLGVRLSGETLVVAQADGSLLKPTSLTHEWTRLSAKTGLPRIRFHDLRHTHATALLANNVNPKIASERLGHSKVGITLDLYSHVMPGMQEDAVSRVDDAYRAAQKNRTKMIC
jgi:integrase